MEFNILIIIIWLPISIIFLKDIFWNLYMWESKEYRFDRFLKYLRWDFEPSNSKINLNILKIIAFCMISLYLFSPILALIGAFVGYFTWTVEMFEFFQTIAKDRFRSINIFYIRNLIVLFLIFISLVFLIALISYPFSSIDRNISTLSNLNQFVQFNINDANQHFPDIYIYIMFSFIFGLFIDFAAPLILSVYIFITSPVSLVLNKVRIERFKALLKVNNSTLISILIIGSKEKSKVRELTYEIIKNKYNTLTSEYTFSTLSKIAQNFHDKIKSDTHVLIIETEEYKHGEIASISKALRPDIIILTDIHIENLGLFKNIKSYINSKMEAIKFIKKQGLLIFNSDNKYSTEISKAFEGEKITFGSRALDKNLTNNITLVKNKLKYGVKYKNKLIPIENLTKENKSTILPIIAIVKELGLTTNSLKNYFQNVDNLNYFKQIEGDNGSILISSNDNETDYKVLLEEIKYAIKLKSQKDFDNIILITEGLKSTGKYKKIIYFKLINFLKGKINTLITSDNLLNKYALKDNIHLNIIHEADIDSLIYESRKSINSKDILIVHGKNTSLIIESLRKED